MNIEFTCSTFCSTEVIEHENKAYETDQWGEVIKYDRGPMHVQNYKGRI